MNDISHLLRSLSYTPNDDRIPSTMQQAATEIDASHAIVTELVVALDSLFILMVGHTGGKFTESSEIGRAQAILIKACTAGIGRTRGQTINP